MSTLDRRQILETIDIEWPKVVQHAPGLHDHNLSLWKSEQWPQELRDVAAQWFPPEIDPDPPHGFSPEQYAEATSEAMWQRHRIIFHLDYDFPNELEPVTAQALVGAMLRHELEHARQYNACPDIFDLFNGLIKPALFQAFGGSIPGSYLNCVPIELDANAAAASYLRDFHPEQIKAIEATDCANVTRTSSGPQSLDTLLSRMVSFLYVFREPAEEWVQPLTVSSYFQSEDAQAIWDLLVALESPRG